jgi:hypothetical protein
MDKQDEEEIDRGKETDDDLKFPLKLAEKKIYIYEIYIISYQNKKVE